MFKYCSFLFILFFAGCRQPNTQNPYAKIEDLKAREIIKKSIEFHGGLENWNSIGRFGYKKDFKLLSGSGSIEKTFKQVHNYDFANGKIIIESKENDSINNVTILSNEEYIRITNGDTLNTSKSKIQSAINTAKYVIGIPFKLLDDGAEIKYIGRKMVNDVNTHEISVSYNHHVFSNHSSTETWKYYFDPEDFRVIANWVHPTDHISWIENLSYERVKGFLLNKERKSYRLDSLGNRLYLRATYSYYDYSIE